MVSNSFHWIRTGTEAFSLMLEALALAKESVRLETYIFRDSELARKFRDALCAACSRGVRVQVLLDALGSHELPNSFWGPLTRAGGIFRWFNPLRLRRLTFRDHRKLLVTDDQIAFVGGYNIGPEYEGDGLTSGWRDLGIRILGPLAHDLALSFDAMFARADFQHPWLTRLRRSTSRQTVLEGLAQLLLSGPGRGRDGFKRSLLHDLSHSHHLRIASAYFLPTGRFRRAIQRVARRGGTVQLILPGKTDVALAQLASRAFYYPLMRAGVQIFEYQPQILHTKLVIVDDACYVGSSNLDARSLNINYELMVRITCREAVREANSCFEDHLAYSQRVSLEAWAGTRDLFTRLKERWAGFVLGRLDPWIMRWQLGQWNRRMLPNRIRRKLPSPISPARPA